MPRLRFSSSIRGRILVGFLTMSLIVGLVGGFGLWAVSQAGRIVTDIYARPLMAINFARSASLAFAQMERERLLLELKPDHNPDAVHATLDRLSKTFFDDLEVAEQRALSDPAREAARAVRAKANRWNTLRATLAPGAAAPLAAMTSLSESVQDQLDTLIELTAGDSFLERQRAVDAIREARWLLTAGLGLALAFSAPVTLVLGRRIVRPLTDAGRVADRIAAGEFYTPIPEAGPDETGVLLRSMHVMQDNIREMMLREQARSWSAQARLIAALESSPDGLVLIDPQGKVVIGNNQVARFFPEAKDALIEGTPFAALLARVAPYHAVDFEGKSPDPELLARRAAHTSDDRYVRLTRATTPEGGCFLLWTDITELKEREARLEVARRQAEAASQAKSSFLAAMSHELRTPLNAIIGFSEMIGGQMLGPLGNAKYQGYADNITSSGRNLLEIINNVLELAKSESGRTELKAGPTAVGPILEACAAMVEPQCAGAALRFTAELPVLPVLVNGDPVRLKQIVLNLLSNAIKFSLADGTVRLGLETRGEDAVITVTDTGIGMSPEQIPIALAPFGQVDNRLARRYDGTGLGLPLTKIFVELHSGRLEIDSALGRGTTVRVHLPRLPPSLRDYSAAASSPPPAVSASDRANLLHLRHVVPEHVLDTVLQGRGRARAAGAGALHVQVDNPILETVEDDVAAVLGHRWAHAGVQQLLDLAYDLAIGFVRLGGRGRCAGGLDHRSVVDEMLHDRAEDRRLQVLPFALGLGHGDEVRAQEHAAHAVDLEQALGQG
jgi:signal transduction histidine kinase